jgi:hypothetical protein
MCVPSAMAEQEVAIAVHDAARYARARQGAQRVDDHALRRVGIVVADPGLEQVAEDVERGRAPRSGCEKAQELLGRLRPRRIEVQVGDEERSHAAELCYEDSRCAPTAGGPDRLIR